MGNFVGNETQGTLSVKSRSREINKLAFREIYNLALLSFEGLQYYKIKSFIQKLELGASFKKPAGPDLNLFQRPGSG